ncbi:hypothetical protein BDQ12DRAFT_689715 [Crucibulum laeve]|uniref:HTH TFE/IIEalpha-type domain-containing protein n=1 Tax=Crucibulum laeve TaxID=68775 RepID=A0A5C3LMV3_9AGAR|nr:hypothetical protein BDQ12DRAFT_689715 [Crucibulum laeve]
MGLQPKELNKVIAVLSNDCLVKVYRQNELKEGAQRSVGKQYYYIDYEHFCNVVKWRTSKMRQIIDSTLRNELDNKGYICTQCKQKYSPLEVDKLMDFAQGTLVCEICRAEVVDNENAESVMGSKDRMQRFNHQMRFIREGLQKSEAMVLPAFDVAAWVKNNVAAASQNTASTPGGLKVAGSDPNKKQDDGVGIMMAMDKDETTRKMERDAQAEAKRQQNALPAWHLKSTITGDLTALGVKENAREQGMNGGSSSNDDILKGLGVVGGRPDQNGSAISATGSSSDDVKLVVNHEADYYDQYYASLAASTSLNSSAQATPTTGFSQSDFGDFPPSSLPPPDDDEEDKKPNVEYLDSLNEYRKRSRSTEDIGESGRGKLLRVGEPGVNGNGAANGHVNGYGVNGFGNGDIDQDVGMGDDASPQGGDDDPVVYVAGAPKLFSEVTEEDHDLMTPDEYTAFFEVMQTRM